MAWRSGDPDPYLADQHGVVYHVVGGTSEPVLDLTAKVMDWQPGAEYGFLAMTFDPRNGRLVVCYNGNDVNTRIESYAVAADGRPDANSVWDILLIEKPGVGHNCGQLVFAETTPCSSAMAMAAEAAVPMPRTWPSCSAGSSASHPTSTVLATRCRKTTRTSGAMESRRDLGKGDAEPVAVLDRRRHRRHLGR